MIGSRSLRTILATLLTVTLAPLTALADNGPRYTYAQAGYLNVQIDDDGTFGGDPDGDGFAVGGSVAVTDMFHLFAGYSDADLDIGPIGVDFTQLSVGGGVNFAVSDTIDLVGQIAYVDLEVDASGFGSADESGYGLFAGARAMVTEAFEVNGGIGYTDLGDGIDGTSLELGALYNFTPMVAAGVGLSLDDDATEWQLGVRLYFGDR